MRVVLIVVGLQGLTPTKQGPPPGMMNNNHLHMSPGGPQHLLQHQGAPPSPQSPHLSHGGVSPQPPRSASREQIHPPQPQHPAPPGPPRSPSASGPPKQAGGQAYPAEQQRLSHEQVWLFLYAYIIKALVMFNFLTRMSCFMCYIVTLVTFSLRSFRACHLKNTLTDPF